MKKVYKMGDLNRMRPTLDKIFSASRNVVLSFRLKELMRDIIILLRNIEEERLKLLQKYGEQKPEGLFLKPENTQVFFTEYNVLLEESVEIEMKMIGLDLLQGINLSVHDVLNIEDFLDLSNIEELTKKGVEKYGIKEDIK